MRDSSFLGFSWSGDCSVDQGGGRTSSRSKTGMRGSGYAPFGVKTRTSTSRYASTSTSKRLPNGPFGRRPPLREPSGDLCVLESGAQEGGRVPSREPGQEVRGASRRGRHLLRGPEGGAVRPAGAERGGQDDDDVHAVRAAPAGRGDDPIRRDRPGGGPDQGQGADRGGPAGDGALRDSVGPREPPLLGGAVRPRGEGARHGRRADARA